MPELKLSFRIASWFPVYVEELRKASLSAAEKGVPKDVVKDNFESSLRSAAFDAVEIGEDDEQPGE